MTTDLAPAAAPASQSHHGHHGPPPAGSIGGALSLVDLRGAPVTFDSLKGGWTLLFFGYSRCTSSCSLAIPAIVEAAKLLNKGGLPARAVLVDIDMPAAAPVRLRNVRAETSAPHMSGHAHAAGDLRQAMEAMSARFGGGLVVATGSRRQLNDAITAFRVNREHVPPRAGETGHSINHSSLVYFIAPDGRAVGYVDHGVAPHEIAAEVRELANS